MGTGGEYRIPSVAYATISCRKRLRAENISGSPEIIEIDGEQPLNWDSISQLNSDVESVPPSTLWGSAPPSPSRDASYTEVRYVRGRSKLLAPTYLPVSDRSRGSVKWPKKSKNTERGRLVRCSLPIFPSSSSQIM